jgi:hypothetical protein
MPEPSCHPHASAELAALIQTLDAVNLLAELTAEDDPRGDRQRAGLRELVLIDYRAFIATASVNPTGITKQQ